MNLGTPTGGAGEARKLGSGQREPTRLLNGQSLLPEISLLPAIYSSRSSGRYTSKGSNERYAGREEADEAAAIEPSLPRVSAESRIHPNPVHGLGHPSFPPCADCLLLRLARCRVVSRHVTRLISMGVFVSTQN